MNVVTRLDSTDIHKPIVFLYCDPDKAEKYLNEMRHLLFPEFNCVLTYAQSVSDGENTLDDIFFKSISLIILPVDTGFFAHPPYRFHTVLSQINENNVPFLPILYDEAELDAFNAVFPGRHCMRPFEIDGDRLGPFGHDELKEHLRKVILDDQRLKEIGSAFDNRIFLSYRKKDIASAATLLLQLTDIDFGRFVSIWWDKHLIPGENFDNAIKENLCSSDAMLLCVTPNLNEEPNYVKDTENQEAAQRNVKVIPAVMEALTESDLSELRTNFPNINFSEISEVSDQLEKLRAYIASRPKRGKYDEAKKIHLVGEAYLRGIGTETDVNKGMDLIALAAEQNDLQAMETLLVYYTRGTFTPCNYDKAILLAQKLRDHYCEKGDHLSELRSEIALIHCLQNTDSFVSDEEYNRFSELLMKFGQPSGFRNDMIQSTKDFNRLDTLQTAWSLYLGDPELRSKCDIDEATVYEWIITFREALSQYDPQWYVPLAKAYCNYAVYLLSKMDYTNAGIYSAKSVEIREMLMAEQPNDPFLAAFLSRAYALHAMIEGFSQYLLFLHSGESATDIGKVEENYSLACQMAQRCLCLDHSDRDLAEIALAMEGLFPFLERSVTDDYWAPERIVADHCERFTDALGDVHTVSPGISERIGIYLSVMQIAKLHSDHREKITSGCLAGPEADRYANGILELLDKLTQSTSLTSIVRLQLKKYVRLLAVEYVCSMSQVYMNHPQLYMVCLDCAADIMHENADRHDLFFAILCNTSIAAHKMIGSEHKEIARNVLCKASDIFAVYPEIQKTDIATLVSPIADVVTCYARTAMSRKGTADEGKYAKLLADVFTSYNDEFADVGSVSDPCTVFQKVLELCLRQFYQYATNTETAAGLDAVDSIIFTLDKLITRKPTGFLLHCTAIYLCCKGDLTANIDVDAAMTEYAAAMNRIRLLMGYCKNDEKTALELAFEFTTVFERFLNHAIRMDDPSRCTGDSFTQNMLYYTKYREDSVKKKKTLQAYNELLTCYYNCTNAAIFTNKKPAALDYYRLALNVYQFLKKNVRGYDTNGGTRSLLARLKGNIDTM